MGLLFKQFSDESPRYHVYHIALFHVSDMTSRVCVLLYLFCCYVDWYKHGPKTFTFVRLHFIHWDMSKSTADCSQIQYNSCNPASDGSEIVVQNG